MFKVTLPFHLTLICFYYHYSFVSSGGSYFSINVYSIQQCASLNESQRLQTQDSTLAQLTLNWNFSIALERVILRFWFAKK